MNEASLDYTSDESDPRFMITNLCDWIVQEIKKKCAKRKKGGEIFEDFVSTRPAVMGQSPSSFSGTREEELWFHVNLFVMVKVWESRLVCSHPDYPLDEESFVRKVDILSKSDASRHGTMILKPPLPKLSWLEGEVGLGVSFEVGKRSSKYDDRAHDEARLEGTCQRCA